jgi:hypothetical protein
MRNCHFVHRKEARELKFWGIERHRALPPNDFAKKIRLQRRLRVPIVQIISLPFNDLTNLDGWRFKRGKPGSVHQREGVSVPAPGAIPFTLSPSGASASATASPPPIAVAAADAVWALAVTVYVAYTASAAARTKGRISDTP